VNPLHRDNSSQGELLEELLAGAAIGDLSADEQEQLSSILNAEGEATHQQQPYNQLVSELQALPTTEVSPGLQQRLMQLSQEQPSSVSPIKKLLALLAAGIAAAGAVVAWQSSGLELQLARKQTAPAQTAGPEQNSETQPITAAVEPKPNEFLLTSRTDPGASATVTIRPEKATNLLVVKGLPQLADGKTYRLWADTPRGQQGCMTFRPDADGNARIQVPSEPSGSAIRLLISIDPIYAGSSAEKPANPVLTSI